MQIDRMLEILLNRLLPILEVHNFRLTEKLANYYKFDSDKVTLTIACDNRDGSISVFVGKKNAILNELDDITILEVFNTHIEKQNKESYVNSLFEFLTVEGLPIIKGDLQKLNELESYSYQRAETYTKNLIIQQNLQKIESAWNEKKYSAFIKLMDMLDKSLLPRSYQIKYKQALGKLKNK